MAFIDYFYSVRFKRALECLDGMRARSVLTLSDLGNREPFVHLSRISASFSLRWIMSASLSGEIHVKDLWTQSHKTFRVQDYSDSLSPYLSVSLHFEIAFGN